jgi:acetyltransferase
MTRPTPFDRLFDPDTVAVVGASTDPDTINGRPQYFLEKHGFDGSVYPVNPNHDEIRGATCYDSVVEAPEQIDVAVLLVPAAVVPSVLEECGESGVPFALISASGFGEVNDDGERLQARIRDIADRHDIRLLGPNCQGTLNLSERVTLSFSSMLKRESLQSGPLGFVTQSGAFGGAVFQMTQDMGIGTKYWASTGNEADVDAVELVEYMLEDPEVEAIVAYIESLKRGEEFVRVARRALEREVPILMMKVGQSERGERAASSHTGKMAGDDAIYRSIFEENGVLALDGIEVFKDAVSTLTTVPNARYPSGEGDVAVVTASGGAGVLIADACEREGVSLATLSEETREAVEDIIPPYGSMINPVDVTGNTISHPDIFRNCISIILADPNVDSVILQFGNSGDEMGAQYREYIADVAAEYGKLVISVFTGGRPPADVLATYRDAGVPTFEDPVRAVRSVALVSRFKRALLAHAERDDPVRRRTAEASRKTLPATDIWEDVQSFAEEFGIPLARGRLAENADRAVAVADDLGYPVVLKGAASGLQHKTEAGAVRTDLHTPAEVRTAFGDVVASIRDYDDGVTVRGAVVQEQVEDGIETIVGILSDTDFGPVMLFGAGGIYTEAFEDVAYRSLPVTRQTARELVDATDIGSVLGGYRGREYDVDDLVDHMIRTGELYEAHDGIRELEMNPVMVDADGATAVDFLIERE